MSETGSDCKSVLVPAEDIRVVRECEADGILESSGVDVVVVVVHDVNRCQRMPTSVCGARSLLPL